MSPLPWHAPLVAHVRGRLADSALPHALLLAGPEGWGERYLANWLALALLGVGEERDAAQLAHPDLRWLEPEGAVIKVDAVREVVEFAHGTPQAGERKVAVLMEAHYLNVNAANALLKTLEEPPPGTHVVLSSCHPGRLLPTVRSRCQLLPIRPDAALARQWLEGQGAHGDLDRPLFEHGGAPVAALEALERGERPLADVIEGAAGKGSMKATVEALLAGGLASSLGRWYRYVLAMAAGTWQPRGLGRVSARALMSFADELTWVRRQLETSNSPNQRLLAERLVARWRYLGGNL